MRADLSFRPILACGLVAIAWAVAARAEDPEAVAAKEQQARRDRQFEESLDWYQLSSGRNPGATMKPRAVMRWVNATRGQKGEPTLILWADAGRPEALASVYPWQKHLVYECVSLARASGLTAREAGRPVWSPGSPGVTFGDVPDAPAPAETPAARLSQAKALAERFKVELAGGGREPLRLLPKPIYRYDLADAKAAHPDLIDGVLFAFVQGTDPEAVLMIEAVRRGGRTAWQYSFGRSTNYPLEAKLGPSVVWVAGSPVQNDPKLPNIVLGRLLVQ